MARRLSAAQRRAKHGKSSFSVDIKKWAEAAEIDMTEATQYATNKIFADTVFGTPVDTGRARGSWTIGNGSLPGRYNSGLDKSGTRVIKQAQARIDKAKPGESIFIASNLVYMPPLEYGHSKQAPRGMLRRAIARWRRYMRDAVRDIRKGR